MSKDNVMDMLSGSVGLSNKDRTAYFTVKAKELAQAASEIRLTEYSLPASNQRGYAMVIPPEAGESADSEYLLLGAHLDSVPSIFNPFYHTPGANDNGFAAAFNIEYAKHCLDNRTDAGIIIAGFPHEEGQGTYRMAGQMALALLTGMAVDSLASEVLPVPSSLIFMLGYLGAFQIYDVIGGPLKMGLAGSAEPFREVIEKKLELDLEQITHAINLDMIGTSGESLEIAIPYASQTTNPGRWLFPVQMDKKLVSELETAILNVAASRNIKSTIAHYLIFGSSDNAELARYMNSTAGIFHINKFSNIHTRKDSTDTIDPENYDFYRDVFDLMRQNLKKGWRDEQQIEFLQEKGLVSDSRPTYTTVESKGRTFVLARHPGSSAVNPLNILYESTSGENVFLDYGIQDNPYQLLRDNNIEGFREMRGKPAEYMRKQAALALGGAADRSIALLTAGMGAAMYGMMSLGQTEGVSSQIQEQARFILPEDSTVYQTTKNLLIAVPGIAGLGAVSGLALKGIMNLVPHMKRFVRKVNIDAYNNLESYQMPFQQL